MSRERKMIVDAQKLYEKYVNASQRELKDGKRSSFALKNSCDDSLSSSDRHLLKSCSS